MQVWKKFSGCRCPTFGDQSVSCHLCWAATRCVETERADWVINHRMSICSGDDDAPYIFGMRDSLGPWYCSTVHIYIYEEKWCLPKDKERVEVRIPNFRASVIIKSLNWLIHFRQSTILSPSLESWNAWVRELGGSETLDQLRTGVQVFINFMRDLEKQNLLLLSLSGPWR